MSANLILEKNNVEDDRSIKPNLRYYFRDGGDTRKHWCVGIHSMVKDEQDNKGTKRNTLTVSCFVRFDIHTSLELIIENGKGMVLRWATVSMQYIGTSGMVPALILPLVDITRRSNERRSLGRDGSFVNSLTGKNTWIHQILLNFVFAKFYNRI